MAFHQVQFRTATAGDCATILHHRRAMFQEMGVGTAQELDRMSQIVEPWLRSALTDGSYRGWLAEEDATVIAGGGLLVYPWPAGPKDPYNRRVTIFNVYTEPSHRKRGLARQLMLLMMDWLRAEGFQSIVLHASDEGRPLYEKLGFSQTNEMRFRFDGQE
jgi:GNAT superfamily N-acetyltransferase